VTDDTNSYSFDRTPASVRSARAALGSLEGRLSASALYDASLCLSELVTNAVQHPGDEAGGKLELRLTLTEAVLRVHVADSGGGFQPGAPTEGDERGWGLFIVDRLASRWGAEPEDERTVIWFEIDRAGSAAADPSSQGSERPRAARQDERRDEVANAVARLRLGPAIQ
jgi:anti-sigma regulatory factor (Ser/Thr protein kinase)